ncbi:MAG: NUDIX domain-containing protein [Mycoplasmatota bacterium]|nr:NUDIX domain-containing protein [Mycoplasmatota bacterium]
MELKNPLYKNIGAHVITAIFTIDKGEIKVLLIKRTNEPFKDAWALPSGAMYNNELILDAAKRELKEKTNLENIELTFASLNDDLNRSPLQRMFAFIFIGLVDIAQANILRTTTKTSDANWFKITEVPSLAYDHNKLLLSAIDKLKEMITSSNILKKFYPNGFTIPELHKVYENILGISIDRRNFRKKLLTQKIIVDTNQTVNFEGKKPAKKYIFNDNQTNKNLF